MVITLAGFMGCGKSTYGRHTAARLGVPFVDLDDYIENKTGKKVAEIFKVDGEKAFRKMEMESLQEILNNHNDNSEKPSLILSLGGGTLTTKECADIIKAKTFCIYLRAKVETLVENLKITGWENRPMLNTAVTTDSTATPHDTEKALRDRIETLMSQREDAYLTTSHLIIDTDSRDADAIASEIATSGKCHE